VNGAGWATVFWPSFSEFAADANLHCGVAAGSHRFPAAMRPGCRCQEGHYTGWRRRYNGRYMESGEAEVLPVRSG
jgi:hypothetical protein